MIKQFLIFGFVVICVLKIEAQQKEQPFFIQDSLNNYVNKALKKWNIPGLGITIVKDNKVVKTQGYGLKNIKEKTLINSKTTFPLASVNKHFTSIALLRELKKHNISTNSSISNYLSKDTYLDASLVKTISFGDILSHQLGFEYYEGDFILFESDFTKRQIINKVWKLKSKVSRKWGYHNTGYVIAGKLLENISNSPIDLYLKQNLFEPLGMNNTFCSFKQLERLPNKFSPYYEDEGVLKGLKYTDTDNYVAAGGVYSTLEDMAKWVKMLLENGKGIVDSDIISEITKEVVDIRKARHPYNKVGPESYGLGLKVQEYQDLKIIYHSGGLPGYVSFMFLVPEIDLGVFFIYNKHNAQFYRPLMYEIIDSYLGLPYRNYSKVYREYYDSLTNKDDSLVMNPKIEKTRLNKLIGTYNCDIYGQLYIQLNNKNEQLKITFQHHPNFMGELTHFDDETLYFDTNSLFFEKITVQISGKKDEIEVSFPRGDPNKYIFSKLN